MRIGITGHQRLPADSAWDWVKQELASLLSRSGGPLVGVSSLAAGADQIFADLVLKQGGSLEVVLPFEGYAERLTQGREAQEFDRLLKSASRVETLRHAGSDEEAYMETGKHVVDISDLIVAVWDKRPPAGLGGTADVFGYAVRRKKPIVHLNPLTRAVESA